MSYLCLFYLAKLMIYFKKPILKSKKVDKLPRFVFESTVNLHFRMSLNTSIFP